MIVVVHLVTSSDRPVRTACGVLLNDELWSWAPQDTTCAACLNATAPVPADLIPLGSHLDGLGSTQLYIRGRHPAVFRSGQWAKVTSVVFVPERFGSSPREAQPCYVVEFVDGRQDWWPVYDLVAEYEFAAAPR